MGIVDGEMMALTGTHLGAAFCTFLNPRTKVLLLATVYKR